MLFSAAASMLSAFDFDMVKLDNLSGVSQFFYPCQCMASGDQFHFLGGDIENTVVSLKIFTQAPIRQKLCQVHISRLKKLVSACCGQTCHDMHVTAFARCMIV